MINQVDIETNDIKLSDNYKLDNDPVIVDHANLENNQQNQPENADLTAIPPEEAKNEEKFDIDLEEEEEEEEKFENDVEAKDFMYFKQQCKFEKFVSNLDK